MEAYSSFALVYDTFMNNVPYEEWAVYVKELLHEYCIGEGIILDMGCGTGTLTELLSGYGYDMIGIDNSGEMLAIAMEKRSSSGRDILYLCQDMREFELYGTVKAIVSICDSVNYILDPEELLDVFRLANNYLDPGGVFIFDFNTTHKYRDVIGECTIAENQETCSFIWDNYYDEEEGINEYDLTLFVKKEEHLYEKYEETHYQRGYELEEIKEILAKAGLKYEASYDAFTRNPPAADSQRICVIAKEHGK